MHVLIIEDEMLIAMQMQTLFEELGAGSTDIALTQAEAVRLARANRPDLITSDIKLSKGDGPSAVREIRSFCGDVPVIYVTANPTFSSPSDAGGTVLVKPIRWLDLVTASSAYGLPSATN